MAERGSVALAFGMTTPARGTIAEIFTTFLRLGTTSFGGPVAHLEYFRREFVERRGWLDEVRFAQLLALCQVLPGPASSQLGFAIGLLRGGVAGALAAFVAFTVPSVLLLFAFAQVAPWLITPPGLAVVHGLKLVAVSVVSHGLLRMVPALAPDVRRGSIAVLALGLALGVPSAAAQVLVIVAGGVLGALWCRATALVGDPHFAVPGGVRTATAASVLFAALLAAALAVPADGAGASLISLGAVFARAGALVFGGGHVVLPLLETSLVGSGWMTADAFLAGYGAAQAVPGPLFSLSAYLGAVTPTGGPPVLGALVATVAVFAPGFLLVLAGLPAWSRVRALPRAGAVIAGVNAAVVGLLGAALVDPILRTAILAPVDVAIAGVGILLLARLQRSPLLVVAWCVLGSLVAVATGASPVG